MMGRLRRGDTDEKTGPMAGQMGGWGSRVGWGPEGVVIPLPSLLLLLQGLTLSAGCQKRETLSLTEHKQTEGVLTDGLPVIGTLAFCACSALRFSLPLIHLFCPLRCPDAAPHPLSISVRGRKTMDRREPRSAASCRFCISP